MTIDTVADAVQFTNANSATAIVQWINGLVRNESGPAATYDSARNIITLPSSTRPGQLEIGWWVIRWPTGDLAAHAPASLASMFGLPMHMGHPRSAALRVM